METIFVGEFKITLKDGNFKVTKIGKKYPQIQIKSSDDIVKYLRSFWEDAGTLTFYESLYVVLLNKANTVLGHYRVSDGSLSGTVADPKKVFQAALLTNSAAIIITHNHPSGSLKLSQADIQMTKKIKDAGNFLDLPLLDHIILTEKGHYSFADEGAL